MRQRTPIRHRTRALVITAAAALAAAAGVMLASPAQAASLVQVTNFGTNPTNLAMHLYVPDGIPAGTRPGILVAVHYCTGSGPAFFSGTQFASLADQYKFIVIYPSATRSGSCFDVSTASGLSHTGNSDARGILSMVQWVEANRNGDPNRVYATGASSGGMMTNVLLADYPDVFKAGAAFMGVPSWCFRTDDPSMWNNACANGQRIMTAQQWGDLARSSFPGYSGARPRMQLWHGTTDTTLAYPNFGEEIKQWTNVLGVSQTPVFTDNPSGWTRTRYGNNSAMAPVEAISVPNVGHSLPLSGQAAMAIAFFGLNTTTPPTSAPPTTSRPPTSAPPTSTPPTSAPPTSRPPTSAPPTTGAPGTCTALGVVQTQWATGYVVQPVNITNNGSSTINGWTVTFTLPAGHTLSGSWNATVTVSGQTVTARSVGFNGTINAGQTRTDTFGFQATRPNGNTALPSGWACTSP